MGTIKSFKKFIKESIWSDIQKRSTGETVRKEDDVNLLDLNEFYKYIKDKYKTKVEYIDLDAMGSGNGDVLGVDITEDIILFYKPKRGHILLSWSRVKIPMPFFDELTDRFKVENPNVMRRIITEKDGSCTNKTFVDVIEFFLKHKESMMNESLWSDIQKRSAGDTIRKEDERHLVMERLLATYIKLFAESCYYHDEYTSGSYPDFRAYIKDFRDNPRIEEVCPDDSYFDDLLNYVNKETWNDQIIDIIMEMTNRLDKGEHLITDDVVEELRKHNVYESIWSDIQKRSSGEIVRKEDEIPQELQKPLAIYIEMFASISFNSYCHYTVGSYPDFRVFVKDFMNSPRIESLDFDMGDLLQYTKEHWDDVVLPIILDTIKKINDDITVAVDNIIDSLKDKNINESIWSDIQKRSTDNVVRKEDEYDIDEDELERSVNTCIKAYVRGFVYSDKYDGSSDTFLKCIQEWDRYICPNAQLYDRRTGKYVEPIKVIPSYIKKNWETGKSYKSLVDKEISEEEKKVKDTGFIKKPGESISDTLSKWFDENFEELEQDFCDEIEEHNAEYHNEGGSRYTDLGVDEWWEDLKYIEQIEIYQEYMKKTNESLWSDIQKRSSGETVRKEDDVNSLDLKDFHKYLKEHYKGSGNTIVYHSDDNFISIVLYMDEEGYFRFLNYNEETIMTQYDVLETLNCVSEMKERYRLDIGYNDYDVHVACIYPKGRTTVNNSFCIDVIDYLLDKIDTPLEQQIVKIDNIKESIWSDIQKRSTGENVRKEDEMTQDDLDAVDWFIFGFATRVVWDGVRDSLTNFLKYIDENPEALDCDIDRVKKYVEDNWHKGICDDVEAAIEQEDKEKEQDLNESIWSDIQKRSSGEDVRKEDDINLLDIDGFYDYLTSRYKLTSMNYEITKTKSHIDVPIFLGDKATFMSIFNSGTDKCAVILSIHKYDRYHYDDFKNALELKYKLDFQYIEKGWYDMYISPKDNNVDRNNSFVVELIDYILDADKPFKNLIERVVNESIWSDIQKRSSGEGVRKEDEVLTDNEISAINEFTLMYCREERAHYIQHHIVPPPPSKRKENDYERFIKYIEDRRDENLFTNVGDYDKIIRYIKKNWDRLDMDKYIKRRIFSPDMMSGKKIVECEGVPGGATPANVGGMGAAYFPGPNGEPGSGDLPSPTGIVYHQVAPYTTFLKQIKKKKRKKKFRKEDEPCVHSPNAKVYDYVDDFRDYVDRTYNNIDKRK